MTKRRDTICYFALHTTFSLPSGGWSNPGGCERSEGARLHRRPDQRVLCPAAAAGSTAVQATTSAAIPATATVPATAATTAAIPAAASSPGSTTPAATAAAAAPEIKVGTSFHVFDLFDEMCNLSGFNSEFLLTTKTMESLILKCSMRYNLLLSFRANLNKPCCLTLF